MCVVLCVWRVRGVWYSRWELPPREEIGSAPAPRPYVPFEGRTTAQDAYVPKVLEDGPTFGTRRETGDGAAPYQRPYIPFEVCVLGVCGCVYGERACVCVGVWCIRSDEVVGGEAVWLSGWMNEGGCMCVDDV